MDFKNMKFSNMTGKITLDDNATLEDYDLINTRHLYGSNGGQHVSVRQSRQFCGNISFSYGPYVSTTDVTINIGKFRGMYAMLGTAFGGNAMTVTGISYDAAGGSVTYRVHHGSSEFGGSGVFHYSVSVSYPGNKNS